MDDDTGFHRHSIWIGQYGKHDGKPLIFIHGGCGVQSRSEELGADFRCPADPAAEQTTRSMSKYGLSALV